MKPRPPSALLGAKSSFPQLWHRQSRQWSHGHFASSPWKFTVLGSCLLCLHLDPSLEKNSQNHRMVGVGRDLWRSSGPTTLLMQRHLKQIVQDYVKAAFEYLWKWRLHNLSVQPVPVLSHPRSKKVLCLDRTSCISVCARCPRSYHWTPLKRVWLCLLYDLLSDIYIHW